MKQARLDDFVDSMGEEFELIHDGGSLPLTLRDLRRLPRTVREDGSFVLEWTAPREPALPQAIYTIRHRGEEYEIFVVPIDRTPDSMVYEAVFN